MNNLYFVYQSYKGKYYQEDFRDLVINTSKDFLTSLNNLEFLLQEDIEQVVEILSVEDNPLGNKIVKLTIKRYEYKELDQKELTLVPVRLL